MYATEQLYRQARQRMLELERQAEHQRVLRMVRPDLRRQLARQLYRLAARLEAGSAPERAMPQV